MSDDLVAFLRARLDEDEAAARGWVLRGTVVMLTEGEPVPADAEYLATFSGARVLAEVAAKRAVLNLHAIEALKLAQLPFDPYTGEPSPDQYEVTCEVCGWASDDPCSACATLLALAAVYSDHPDYPLRSSPSPDPGDEEDERQTADERAQHGTDPS